MNEYAVTDRDEYKERYAVVLDLPGFKALECAAEEDKREHDRL